MSDGGAIRVGSACSGSCIADVSLHVVFSIVQSEIEVDPNCLQVVFACEFDKDKARFLIGNLDIPIVFADVRTQLELSIVFYISGID